MDGPLLILSGRTRADDLAETSERLGDPEHCRTPPADLRRRAQPKASTQPQGASRWTIPRTSPMLDWLHGNRTLAAQRSRPIPTGKESPVNQEDRS